MIGGFRPATVTGDKRQKAKSAKKEKKPFSTSFTPTMTVNGYSAMSDDKNGSLSMDTKPDTTDLEKEIADLESRLHDAKSLLTSSRPAVSRGDIKPFSSSSSSSTFSPLSHNPSPKGMLFNTPTPHPRPPFLPLLHYLDWNR